MTKKIGGKEIYNEYFITVEDKRHKCKVCSRLYTQDIKKGYSNLVTHIQNEHSDRLDVMKVNDEKNVNPFFHKESNTIFNWLDCIIGCELPLSFCEGDSVKDYSKLAPVSVEDLMKYIPLITDKVEKKIADSLPDQFGIIIDGWNEDSTYHIALFANFDGHEVGPYPLLAIAPPIDETDFTIESHHFIIECVLERYGKSSKNLIYLVAENTVVNTGLADLLGIPMIGCASHRFHLACKKYLEGSERILQKIQSLMMTLQQRKHARKLQAKTDLVPIIWNVLNWKTLPYEMVSSFFRIEEFIDATDEDLATKIPTASEMIDLKRLMEDLEQFQATAMSIQEDERNLHEVRLIFDEMLKHYPIMDNYISSNGALVHSPDFEGAIIQVIDNYVDSLNARQEQLLTPFRKVNNVRTSEVQTDVPYALQALKKKRRFNHNAFIDLSFIPPTCNIMRKSFKETAYCMFKPTSDPDWLNFLMFLKINRQLWDYSLVSNLVING
ncbi:hypothetical protein BC833DRAFT_603924 [Globomyces pollinis-pini]|nr:hypothetical protein BC833DRAFT_603924 [Globomyces pollinis-pini]